MVKFIADIGSNHNKSFDRTIELVETAKEVGCWGVKFQLFKAENLYHENFDKQIEITKQREFPVEWLYHLKSNCQELDIKLGATPFSVDFLNDCYTNCDFIKISSFDIKRKNLLNEILKTGIIIDFEKTIISLGLANLNEILKLNEKILKIYNPLDEYDIYFLHCISNYPTKINECNLSAIPFLKNILHTNNIGWSDHAAKESVIYQAVSAGAKIIEFHLDLEDGKGFESYHGHCWTPSKIKNVIETVNEMETANGSIQNYLEEKINDDEKRKWMADPDDGLRPLKEFR